MSKNTTRPLTRIIKLSARIAYFEEKIKQTTGKKKHYIHQTISYLKRALNHYSKLYIWGAKPSKNQTGDAKKRKKLLLAA